MRLNDHQRVQPSAKSVWIDIDGCQRPDSYRVIGISGWLFLVTGEGILDLAIVDKKRCDPRRIIQIDIISKVFAVAKEFNRLGE